MLRLCFLIDTVALLAGLYGFLTGRLPATTPTILVAVFGFIGINMLLGSFFSYRKTSKWLAKSVRVTGEVIDHAGKESVDSFNRDEPHYDTVYYPVVRYRTQTGQTVTFTSSVGSSQPSHSIGQSVGVVYLPNELEKAEIDEFMSLWLVPVILMGIGFPMLVASLGIAFSVVKP
ncbi:DUF3592 domain-containing protein [Spirosoma sp. KNUC1025]|uniref:DUF3592 domain-containing protein n=1 Tax=Spirosoma sp. KNUC1025 TaxID=2894082 RepID=UPI001E2FA2BB|nr:DUF3592 domain-containing protein [Spirosoma sp. KNUC1025]UFH57535.1 DUF3592 domain-containing protein [Spirosoma sp. KNUC1025]